MSNPEYSHYKLLAFFSTFAEKIIDQIRAETLTRVCEILPPLRIWGFVKKCCPALLRGGSHCALLVLFLSHLAQWEGVAALQCGNQEGYKGIRDPQISIQRGV